MKRKRKLGIGIQKRKLNLKKKIEIAADSKRKSAVALKCKVSKRKHRVIPTRQKGGFLSLLFSILGALGALRGGAAGIAKAVNDSKANK